MLQTRVIYSLNSQEVTMDVGERLLELCKKVIRKFKNASVTDKYLMEN